MLGDGAYLIGQSWGGADVLLAAARRRDAVCSLTVVEPALQALTLPRPRTEPQASESAAAMMQDMAGMLLNSETLAQYMRNLLDYLGISDGLGTLEDAIATVVKAGIRVLVISGGWKTAVDDPRICDTDDG